MSRSLVIFADRLLIFDPARVFVVKKRVPFLFNPRKIELSLISGKDRIDVGNVLIPGRYHFGENNPFCGRHLSAKIANASCKS